jgi:adenosine kinase
MDILITGSIAFDYLMRFPGKFRDAMVAGALDKISVSFLVDEMTRHYGGVAANIAYNLALLGSRPRLMGTVGRDFGDYRDWLDRAGVDTSTVIVIDDLFTASFFANTDVENNQIASFYAGAMGRAGQYKITDVTDRLPELVVISPNAPDAMENLINECQALNIPFLYDPSQQAARLDGDKLRHGIERCKILMVNEYEWEMVEQKTGLTRVHVINLGITLIITQGKEGAHIYDGDETYYIPPFENLKPLEPTGVGDAFRAGVLRGIECGWSWDICGRVGAVAAAYVLEATGTQNHHYTPAEFVQRFREQFDDQGALDSLLTSGEKRRA